MGLIEEQQSCNGRGDGVRSDLLCCLKMPDADARRARARISAKPLVYLFFRKPSFSSDSNVIHTECGLTLE